MNIQQNSILLAQIGVIERRIQENERSLKSTPERAEVAKLRAVQLEQKSQETQTQLTALVLKRRHEEQELNTERSNLRKWEKRANEIQGERAYSGLMSEISSKKKMISESEDRILQFMQEIENAESELVVLRKSADDSAAESAREWDFVKEKMAQINSALVELRSELKGGLSQLDATLQARYQRVSGARQGLGVAFLEKEVCQSCRQMVPPELFLKVFKCAVIEQCPSCQRILVVKPASAIDTVGIA